MVLVLVNTRGFREAEDPMEARSQREEIAGVVGPRGGPSETAVGSWLYLHRTCDTD